MSLHRTQPVDIKCPHCNGNIRIMLTEKQLTMLLQKIYSKEQGKYLRTDQIEQIIRNLEKNGFKENH